MSARFHTLEKISELPDLKRPLRFKPFQILQLLQLSPPAESPGVVNLTPKATRVSAGFNWRIHQIRKKKKDNPHAHGAAISTAKPILPVSHLVFALLFGACVRLRWLSLVCEQGTS